MKKKLVLFLFTLCFVTGCSVEAITIEEINSPLAPANRLGVGNSPENSYKVTVSENETVSKTAELDKNSEVLKDITYADLSLKKIAQEISADGELDSENMLADIQLLWVGAAQNSETVKFIVYKLSNPDEDKPNESIVKKIIQPLSTVGSLAGIGIGNPVAALSSIMGSSVLGSMSVSDKDLNYKFSKVNDADMIVLIRKVEELQRKIVHYYYDYMTSRELLVKSDAIVSKRKNIFANAQELSNEQIIMIDALYRDALNKQTKLRSDYLSKRSALEQIVGSETLIQFEDNLTARENKTSKN